MKRSALFLILFVFLGTSCDSLNSVKNLVTRHLAKWGLVDKEDQKSKKENKTSAQKSLPSSLSLPDEAQVSFGQVEAEALDQVPEDIPTPVPDSDSQEALPNPEPAVVAPETMPQVPSALVSNLAGLLDSIVRFGGMPHFISYDCGVVLMGSHQKISVLDENLKTLQSLGFKVIFAENYHYFEYYPSYEEFDLFLRRPDFWSDASGERPCH